MPDLIRAAERAESVISAALISVGAPHLRDLAVLDEIKRSGAAGVRTNQLATRVGASTSRIAHHLKSLESRGLASRRPHDTDGRGVVIHLTDKGRRTLAKGVAALDRLTANQLEELRGQLPVEALRAAHMTLMAELTNSASRR
ncbi:MAG: MarR family transcriptional regulator [Actinomycetes bacterium]